MNYTVKCQPLISAVYN